MKLDVRGTYLLGALVMIIGVVGMLVLRAQYLGKIPCPLCVLEFLVLALIALIMLFVTWFYPLEGTQYFCGFLMIGLAVVGVILSLRHLMLLKALSGTTTANMCFDNEQDAMNALLSPQVFNTVTEAFNHGICEGSIAIAGINLPVWFLFGFVFVIVFVLAQMRRLKTNGLYG